MTPEEFNQVAANLAAGFYTDAETLRRFVAEAVRLRVDNERLKAELDELRRGYILSKDEGLDRSGDVRLGGAWE